MLKIIFSTPWPCYIHTITSKRSKSNSFALLRLNLILFYFSSVSFDTSSNSAVASSCVFSSVAANSSLYPLYFFSFLLIKNITAPAMTINNKAPPIIIMFLLLKETPSSFFPVTGVEAVSSGVVVSSSIISGDVARNLCIVPSTVS